MGMRCFSFAIHLANCFALRSLSYGWTGSRGCEIVWSDIYAGGKSMYDATYHHIYYNRSNLWVVSMDQRWASGKKDWET